ncbi:hypothetical protein Tco_0862838 [Tanacetum coccineum]
MFQKRDWNVRKKSGGGTLPGRVESLGLGRRNCSRGATDWGVGSRVDCWGGVGATNKKLFLIADAAQMDEIEELSTNICMMVRIQLANIDSDEGPSYDSAFIKQRKQVLELQTAQTSLKRKMNANEDKYLDDVLSLEAKLKKNENVVIKMSNYVQALFMLGPKPLSVYDPQLKHGLGYKNPYTLNKALSQNPKLYDASNLHNSKVHVNVCDTEEILDDGK